MAGHRTRIVILTAVLIVSVSMLIGWVIFSGGMLATSSGWTVGEDGVLSYQVSLPEYSLSKAEDDGNSSLSIIQFTSRGAIIEGLLRITQNIKMDNIKMDNIKMDNIGIDSNSNNAIPGIVLLPGATVTKEREQGLARQLADLGYATLTLDQRNLGGINMEYDSELFAEGREPLEHMMVYDALAAAEVLRSVSGIDAERIVYAGESNGGRFAIIASALDKRSKGALAISTSGYGTDAALARAGVTDRDTIRFYRSIDPETYFSRVSPRPLVMIHSRNDTVIPYSLAEQTYALASQPKSLTAVGCSVHGYCQEMNGAIKTGLERMVS